MIKFSNTLLLCLLDCMIMQIPLLPNATPVNCRPYRYSPTQKDEIERHVDDMLTLGLIVPSLSPFASPILLVKKRIIHRDYV
jgi:hypothetical protein